MGAMDRRDALRLGALGITGTLFGPLLGACGTTGSGPGDAAGASVSHDLLEPFEPARSTGRPTGLPRRVGWANTAAIGIFEALGAGMRAAAEDTGLDYITANCQGDPQTNINQIRQLTDRGVGGLTIQPLNLAAQQPLMQSAVASGVCVFGIISHPAVVQVAARQYDIGFAQGRAAASYIARELGGRATVFNQNLSRAAPQLAVRNRGLRDGLRSAGPGVKLIDEYLEYVAPDRVFTYVSQLLLRHPDINVFMGGDGFVLPAYHAFQQLGRLRDDMYFSSIDGDPDVIELVAQGGPYRACSAFAWTLMGYGMGRITADWIDGRPVPRVMVAKNTLLNSPAKAKSFRAAAAEPRATYGDRAAYARYVPLLGTTSYADRARYWTTDYEPRAS